MNENVARKEPPEVPNDAGEDRRNYDEIIHIFPERRTLAGAQIIPSQAEPKNFAQGLDLKKLEYGQKLIGWCIFFLVILALLAFFANGTTEGAATLHSVIELLKLVTTTALGFVFAKTQETHPQDET